MLNHFCDISYISLFSSWIWYSGWMQLSITPLVCKRSPRCLCSNDQYLGCSQPFVQLCHDTEDFFLLLVFIWIDQSNAITKPNVDKPLTKTCWIIKVINSPELYPRCFSDKASSHLQPINDVLSLLYSFELCLLLDLKKTPCRNESAVTSVSWKPWFDLRQVDSSTAVSVFVHILRRAGCLPPVRGR